MKDRRGKIKALLVTIALAVLMSVTALSQERVEPPQAPPTEKPKIKIVEPSKPVVVSPRNERQAPPPGFRFETRFGGETTERSIAVDPKIAVALCVSQGTVKINGWSRSEVRVFVKDGSKIGFDVVQANRQSGKPVWIKVVGADPKKPSAAKECLWGGAVELDVPVGASVVLEGKETATTVDSIRKVKIKNIGGNISINNVSEGIEALTYEGNVDVENSEGAVSLESSSGNIVVFESGPSEVGDTFRAKTTSGAISIQRLTYRQVDASSISGTVVFNSELLPSGIYNIGTQNGSIVLTLPTVPQCFVSATYGFGRFDSEIPIKTITVNEMPGPIQTMRGTFGESTKQDCKLSLTTSSGTIRIRKK
jgi:hypothetical protein